MYELAHPWVLILLFLPLLMRFLPAYKETRDSVRVPFFDTLVELSEQQPGVVARPQPAFGENMHAAFECVNYKIRILSLGGTNGKKVSTSHRAW